MQSFGSGLTFTEIDLTMARRLVGLLNSTKFHLDPLQMVQGAEALMWLQKELLINIEANIMELKKVVQTKPDEEAK